ncbi:MAG: GNAT family N-acetyltransferase [Bacteroidia bacterium]|nr:GNAT family N-acetyltransferase [Bacteroidia bacterium]
MPDLTLTKATITDIPEIGRLARITWNQHYPAIITQAQIDYMLNLMYDAESLKQQMQEKGHVFYLIGYDKTTVGFISVNNERDGEWFLNKFYIDQSVAAKGLGSKAFEALKHILSPTKITLTVNRQNFKSVNFYFKQGFKIERVADFDIGNDYVMNDFVMVWMKN